LRLGDEHSRHEEARRTSSEVQRNRSTCGAIKRAWNEPFLDTSPMSSPVENVARCVVRTEEDASGITLVLSGMADIAAAKGLKSELVQRLVAGRDVTVRLELDRIDGAGLQLLLAASAWVQRHGGHFRMNVRGGAADGVVKAAGALAHLAGEGDDMTKSGGAT
jgi:anti-anti-sigma regulatory factor